jgi:pimeloyl-ACP methyl ester carboxylesterase
VHGAWGGGWDWKHVDQLLTADGYKVYRPTLTGQGERSHLASTNIDLDTHIQDIVNVIVWEDLHDVVLVGHSYGGMVITGVADRVPDRIRRLVYVDAFVPDNGESANEITIAPALKKPVTNGFVMPLAQGEPAAAARRAACRPKPSANPSR